MSNKHIKNKKMIEKHKNVLYNVLIKQKEGDYINPNRKQLEEKLKMINKTNLFVVNKLVDACITHQFIEKNKKIISGRIHNQKIK